MPETSFTKREFADILRRLPLGPYSNRVRYAVVLSGQTQDEIAAASDLHISALSQILRGRRRALPEHQRKLARYFGVPISVLFPDDHTTERVA